MQETEFTSITEKADVERRVKELKRRDDDIKARVGPFLKLLWDPERRIQCAPEPVVFDRLQQSFPNFSEVINHWRVCALVSTKTNTRFVPDPVLLGGDPGVGKTFFASQAAEAMGLFFHEISLATATANFVISGGSLQWGNGTPGEVAQALCRSDIANPFILIDEVDKAGGDSRYDTITPFYSLLERHSAKRFKDECLGIHLDASNVIWAATANDIKKIPAPILSRMVHFEISRPDSMQMIGVVQNIYTNIRAEKKLEDVLAAELKDEVIDILVGFPPREVRKILTGACMKAISDDRDMPDPEDFPQTEDFSQTETVQQRRIGFI